MLEYLKYYTNEIKRSKNGSYKLLSLVKNYPRWKRSVKSGTSPLQDGTPWMTFEAIDFLEKNLGADMVIFEYGSGGSSVYFAKHAKHVYSVEHDKEWFELVHKYISEKGINNWEGTFVNPEPNSLAMTFDPSDPDTYSTSDNNLRNYLFENYVKMIDKFPDECFDLIVIDGRARPSCIKHSISKLKKGGFLLVDNAERDSYQSAIKNYLSKGFSVVEASYGATSHNMYFTKTEIWKKVG